MNLFTFSRFAGAIAIAAAAAPLAAQTQPLARPPVSYGQSRAVPDQYIVRFKSDVADVHGTAATLVRGAGGQLRHTYAAAIKGFAASLPAAAVQALRHNPNVASVEQDMTVSLNQLASPENQADWGLDRIDQTDRPLDTQYHFAQTGAGVNAFVIDTGLRADHVEFTGRVLPGYGAVADGNGTNDCHGHGTHVSGTIGGTTWGVAKAVNLIPVRVLDCNGSGTMSDVIAGIDWVANSPLRPAVANLSLGGSALDTLDAAVAGAVGKGVTMVVAAGNNSTDACTVSPAREPSAITVGATASSDSRAYYSNIGTCLDLFAPGSSITSAWNTSATATNVLSGTSMAAPHVAAVAALLLETNPGATPQAIAAAIVGNATPNRLTSIGTGSPNLLLFSLASGAAAPQPATITVAFKSMTGSGTRTGGNWKASAVVTVRDVNTGAAVSNATVTGSFAPGGTASCVTASTGTCTLTSGSLKGNSTPSTTFSGTGISGTLLQYDATQNAVSQIVISRP